MVQIDKGDGLIYTEYDSAHGNVAQGNWNSAMQITAAEKLNCTIIDYLTQYSSWKQTGSRNNATSFEYFLEQSFKELGGKDSFGLGGFNKLRDRFPVGSIVNWD